MAEPLKDVYNRAFINRLAKLLSQQHAEFDSAAFKRRVFNQQWAELPLKSRMQHISASIEQSWPLDYPQAIAALQAIAPEFSGFAAMLFPDYVEQFGQQHWQLSLTALGLLTRHSSSEFAVRPFILAKPQTMMKQMLRWAKSANVDERRLASEGCRPRLPWAMALPMFKQDPSLIVPILEQLKNDPSLYVRRSVANNLNDIAKDNPDLCVQICCAWYGDNADTDWIVKHASRTLLKQARPELMQLFGYQTPDELQIKKLNLNKKQLHIGDDLLFDFDVTGNKPLGKLRIEYQIQYAKANGKSSNKKFSLGEFNIDENSKRFRRKQSFAQMSTRKHYPGDHRLSIFVNGLEQIGQDFLVKASK